MPSSKRRGIIKRRLSSNVFTLLALSQAIRWLCFIVKELILYLQFSQHLFPTTTPLVISILKSSKETLNFRCSPILDLFPVPTGYKHGCGPNKLSNDNLVELFLQSIKVAYYMGRCRVDHPGLKIWNLPPWMIDPASMNESKFIDQISQATIIPRFTSSQPLSNLGSRIAFHPIKPRRWGQLVVATIAMKILFVLVVTVYALHDQRGRYSCHPPPISVNLACLGSNKEKSTKMLRNAFPTAPYT